MSDTAERRRTFRQLHEQGCFIIPNPWDTGSARYLESLGFKALATTSSGAAFSRGKADGGLGRDETLAHIREIVEATRLPVNADFEDGHGRDPREVEDNVRACLDTGVAGVSIEDSTGDPAAPLYEIGQAVERMRAARAAVDSAGGDALLVGRAECFLTGHPDALAEAIRRLKAYSEAGADCLYAPGLRSRAEIEAVVRAVAPKPINLLVGRPMGLTLADIAALGVRRVSVGGALAAAAWGGFIRAATGLTEGSFDEFANNAATADLNALFASA